MERDGCSKTFACESVADAEKPAIVLCDRGTVDGNAHWIGPSDLFSSVGTTLDEQIKRYDAVIHLRTPALGTGYNHQNRYASSTAEEASAIVSGSQRHGINIQGDSLWKRRPTS
jgi:hypothetical protein